jgi:hypothetical protein
MMVWQEKARRSCMVMVLQIAGILSALGVVVAVDVMASVEGSP